METSSVIVLTTCAAAFLFQVFKFVAKSVHALIPSALPRRRNFFFSLWAVTFTFLRYISSRTFRAPAGSLRLYSGLLMNLPSFVPTSG